MNLHGNINIQITYLCYTYLFLFSVLFEENEKLI